MNPLKLTPTEVEMLAALEAACQDLYALGAAEAGDKARAAAFKAKGVRYVGKAKSSQFANDLFWSIFLNGKTLRWSGYNDGYWWKNVAGLPSFQIQEHCGKRYQLDPLSDTVCEVLPTA